MERLYKINKESVNMEKDNKVRINISVDKETEAKLKEIAKNAHCSVSQWVTDRVWAYENEHQQLIRLLEYQCRLMDKGYIDDLKKDK